MKITSLGARDIRFPTSREKEGSDALNLGDYSAVYVTLETDGPHAGGVGLCEYVQHLAIYDYIAVNPRLENRYCEYVDQLHEHFVHPVRVVNARYEAPLEPGYSIEMKEASLAAHEFPGGRAWSS